MVATAQRGVDFHSRTHRTLLATLVSSRPMETYARLLLKELHNILALGERLIEVSRIRYTPRKANRHSLDFGAAISAAFPECTWEPLDDEGRRRQREALECWNRWSERARLMFSGDTETSQNELNEAAATVMEWIDRSGRSFDFSVPQELAQAPGVFRKHVQGLEKLLMPFQADGPLVVVPDTNVLLRNQDLPSWTDVLQSSSFTVLLVPGVLAELDEQKMNHRVPEVREKAMKFTNRIRGWRNQGSLSAGIRVQGEVYVRVTAREPNFKNTLSWLDPTVVDDRILASVLEWQRANPMTAVLLLSADTIMLAKADEAGVPTGDVPDRQ
jgi:hypothetical protein